MKKIVCLALVTALLMACMAPVLAEEWICGVCGAGNERKFCTNCGSKKPACSACGFEPKPGRTYKFCPECGVKFDPPVTVPTATPMPTATPTPKPAPTPTPKPVVTPTPAPKEGRTFYINEINISDGVATIHWQDSAGKGPYKVCYECFMDEDYGSAAQQAVIRWVAAKEVNGNTLVLDKLVPGKTYWLTVFDAEGEMAKLKFDPLESPDFRKFSMTGTFTPRSRVGTTMKDLTAFSAADILAGGDTGYGAYVRLDHEAVAETMTLRGTVAITCPDGTYFVESVEDLKFEAGSTCSYWEFYDFNLLFETLQGIYVTVPQGEYSWELYLDGLPAVSLSFTVN